MPAGTRLRPDVGSSGTRTSARPLRRSGSAGTRHRSGVWEGEIMAAEPTKTEIHTLFKRLRAAPANKVTGRHQAASSHSEMGCCSAAAAWARARPHWSTSRAAAAEWPGRELLGPGENGQATGNESAGLRQGVGEQQSRRRSRLSLAVPLPLL